MVLKNKTKKSSAHLAVYCWNMEANQRPSVLPMLKQKSFSCEAIADQKGVDDLGAEESGRRNSVTDGIDDGRVFGDCGDSHAPPVNRTVSEPRHGRRHVEVNTKGRSRSVNFAGSSSVDREKRRLQRTPTPYWPRKEMGENSPEDPADVEAHWCRQDTVDDVDESDLHHNVSMKTRQGSTELYGNALFRRGLERQSRVRSRDTSPTRVISEENQKKKSDNATTIREFAQELPDKLFKAIVKNASLGDGQ